MKVCVTDAAVFRKPLTKGLRVFPRVEWRRSMIGTAYDSCTTK